MAFSDRLVHALAIVTPRDAVSGAVDDYGHPVAGTPDIDLVSGLIQPRTARRTREVALTNQGGAAIGDHTVFLELDAPVSTTSYVRFDPDDGDRYEVVGIRRYDFGREPHLEVDSRRIVSDALVTS
jgi:hypothetical protein